MPRYLFPIGGALGLLLSTCAGCAGHNTASMEPQYAESLAPGQIEPADANEQELLRRIAKHPQASTQKVGPWLAVVGEPYDSASGRQCCSITLRKPVDPSANRERLACRSGGSWFFAPPALVAGSEWEAAP